MRRYLRALRVSLALPVALICAVAPARARASGVVDKVLTDVMFRQVVLLKHGVTYDIQTKNLSGGSDTILHVLSFPDGTFIAGDDDVITPDPEGINPPTVSPRSEVEIQPANIDRTVFVVVRGKPGKAAGTANLEIQGFTLDSNLVATIVSDKTINISFAAGFVQNVPSLLAGTHITTVENNLGTVDTILMVVGSDPAHTLGFDDDDGVDRMSFLRLSTGCAGTCQIIVGTPQPSVHLGFININVPPGPVRVVWDETIESHDSDLDGISDELESMLGTKANSGDTDGDGIPDGFELYGAQLKPSRFSTPPPGAGKTGNVLKFPKYGSNPVGRDVFLEGDWLPSCPASDPNCCTGGACLPGKIDADGLRLTEAIVNVSSNAMNASVQPHFDIGTPTSAAAAASTIFGDWGGANRLGDGEARFAKQPGGNYIVSVTDGDCYRDVQPARVGYFHHLIVNGDGTSNGRLPECESPLGIGCDPSACAFVIPDGGDIAHELGHNFNLHHGGPANSSDQDLNCKMNYASIMSYPNQGTNGFAHGYSIGKYTGITMNGVNGLNEISGLNDTTMSVLSEFSDTLGGFVGAMSRGRVDSVGGGIDWNMDGRIGSPAARAPVNWTSQTCGTPYINGFRATFGTGAAFPTLDVTTAATASAKLYVVNPNVESNAVMIGEVLNGAPDCVLSSSPNCTEWGSRTQSQAFTSPPASGLAVAGPLIVYRNQFGTLAYVTMSSASAWNSATDMGAPVIVGDPAAIETGGKVKVYAVTKAGQLVHWEYDEASATWPVRAVPETWEDGTLIQSAFGIAVAHGALSPAGEGIFAAIPNTNGVAAASPKPIQFAQLVTVATSTTITVPAHGVAKFPGLVVPAFTFTVHGTADHWQRLTSPGVSAEFARPGLAYVPFDLAARDDGRFYLSFVPGPKTGGFQAKTARIIFTEGNNTAAGAADRRFAWMPNQMTKVADDNNQSRDLSFGGMQLGRFGKSLVGAAYTGGTLFMPAADGIFNMNALDHDDVVFVGQNLSCSLHEDDCDD